ncbi:hypothetical protein [Verrucomicrobium spinosum]|uniref:hypothetical protein n=1 Tax=Verrucomicrobium spinosum TaxID=2736 RepID=UPI0009E8AF5D|nr:hypothetical protein [Verrucomicrobium spinosum]
MTDSDFQKLIEHLAGESPPEEVFENLDPADLSPEQRKELALFLRTQTLIKQELAGGEAFVRRVMTWAGESEKDTFTAKVIDLRSHGRETKRSSRSLAPWWVALAACIAAAASWWRPASPLPGR